MNTAAVQFLNSYAWLPSIIFAGVGGYFGAYLKRKGENLATHEDIDKLVEQVEATTEATKAIEAKIESEVWDRQKQWELTRDAAIKVLEVHGRLEDSAEDVVRVCGVSRYASMLPGGVWTLEARAALEQWRAAYRSVIDVLVFLDFACWTKETHDALSGYIAILRSLRHTSDHDLPHEILKSSVPLISAFRMLREAIRNEMRLHAKHVPDPIIPDRSTEKASPLVG